MFYFETKQQAYNFFHNEEIQHLKIARCERHAFNKLYIYSRNTRLRRDFPRPPRERRLGRLRCPFGKPPPWAAVFSILNIVLPPPKAAVSQMGTRGAAPPEEKENSAEGGCFVNLSIMRYM